MSMLTPKILENRLIEFSVLCIKLGNHIPNSVVGSHLSNQLFRSGTSIALNYGEAQAAESRKDFIHKMKICLKEMRETNICIQIIKRAEILRQDELIAIALDEIDQLISIFVKSINTASSQNRRSLIK